MLLFVDHWCRGCPFLEKVDGSGGGGGGGGGGGAGVVSGGAQG